MKKEHVIVFISFLIFFSLMAGFTCVIYKNSFEKLARESVLENCSFVCSESVDKLREEYANKNNPNTDSVKRMFHEAISCMPPGVVKDIELIDGAKIVCSLNLDIRKGSEISEYLKNKVVLKADENFEVIHGEELHYLIPVYAGKSIDIILNAGKITDIDLIKKQLGANNLWLFATAGAAVLIAVFMMLVLVKIYSFKKEYGTSSKWVMFCATFILMLFIQVNIYYFHNSEVKKDFNEILKSGTGISAEWMTRKINTEIENGSSYDKIVLKPENSIELSRFQKLKQVKAVYIKDINTGNLLMKSKGIDYEPGSHSVTYMGRKILESTECSFAPLAEDMNSNQAGLYMVISNTFISDKRIDILLYLFLPILALSFLITLEVSRFAAGKLDMHLYSEGEVKHVKSCFNLHAFGFIFVTGIAITLVITFGRVNELWNAEMMPEILKADGNGPGALAYAAPIASGMLFCSVAFWGKTFLRKLWRNTFVIGVIISCAGILCAAFCVNLLFLCILYCICGLGTGCCLASLKDAAANEGELIGDFGRGLLAGLLCGVTAGTLIYDNLGWQVALYVSVLIVVASGIGVLACKNENLPVSSKDINDMSDDQRVHGNRFTLILFHIILIQISVLEMLFYFAVPYIAYNHGMGQKFIVIVGMIIVALGFFTAWMGRYISKVFTSFVDLKLYAVFCSIFAHILLLFAIFMPGEDVVRNLSLFSILFVSAAIFAVQGEKSSFLYFCDFFSYKETFSNEGKWNALIWFGRALGVLILGCIFNMERELIDNIFAILCILGINIAILFMIFTWSRYKNTVITEIKE